MIFHLLRNSFFITLSLDQIKRAELNRVLHETKRLVCLCCRVHTGNNLSDLVQQECTPEHEEKYKQLFSKNLMQDKQKIKENIKLLKEENMIRKSYEIELPGLVNFCRLKLY